jgi:hypothetical protein
MLIWWPARIPEPSPEAEKRKEEAEQFQRDAEDLSDRVEEFKKHQPGSTVVDDQVEADEPNGETVDVHMLEDIELDIVERAKRVHRVPLEVVTDPPVDSGDLH